MGAAARLGILERHLAHATRKLFRTKNQRYFPRWQATVLTIVPMLYTNYTYFYHRRFEQIQDAFAAERPGNTVVLWERGLTAWRKVGYYAPGVKMRVSLQPGTRVVGLLNPRTAFPGLVKQNFSVTAAGPVYYADLPAESGSRLLGEYEIAW